MDFAVFCGACVLYRADADRPGQPSFCKRLDHKRIRFRRKVFLSYDCGRLSPNICREFVPSDNHPALQSAWRGYDDYAPLLPRDEVALEDAMFPGVTFYVPQSVFSDGAFLNADGSILWSRKQYYKGRKLLTEFPDGTVVQGNCKKNEGV